MEQMHGNVSLRCSLGKIDMGQILPGHSNIADGDG